jgi:hypothetical protein
MLIKIQYNHSCHGQAKLAKLYRNLKECLYLSCPAVIYVYTSENLRGKNQVDLQGVPKKVPHRNHSFVVKRELSYLWEFD